MLIGSVRHFYGLSEEDEIEVIKDTWAIEVKLKTLHEVFFSQFPERMYELLVKPLIFE